MFPSTPVGFTLRLLHKAVTARANIPDTFEVTFLCTRRHDRHKGFQHRMMSLGMLSLTSRRLRPRNLTQPGKWHPRGQTANPPLLTVTPSNDHGFVNVHHIILAVSLPLSIVSHRFTGGKKITAPPWVHRLSFFSLATKMKKYTLSYLLPTSVPLFHPKWNKEVFFPVWKFISIVKQCSKSIGNNCWMTEKPTYGVWATDPNLPVFLDWRLLLH